MYIALSSRKCDNFDVVITGMLQKDNIHVHVLRLSSDKTASIDLYQLLLHKGQFHFDLEFF